MEKGHLGISWALCGLNATAVGASCDFVHRNATEWEAEESKELG